MIVIKAFYCSVTIAGGTARGVRGCIFHLKTSLISDCYSYGISKRSSSYYHSGILNLGLCGVSSILKRGHVFELSHTPKTKASTVAFET